MSIEPARGRPAGDRAAHDFPSGSRRRTAGQVLTEARVIVEPAYRAALAPLSAELRHIAGYHAGWWDAQGRPIDDEGRGSKGVRAALVLASARAAARGRAGASGGEEGKLEGAVRAAVAVSLVHDFSLLHDDVMDGDLTRRGRPTAWAQFGLGAAILVGDALLALAMEVLAGAVTARSLSGALLELCAGQSADLAFERRTDVTMAECLSMAEAKTGALLGVACELGALAGGAQPAIAACYREFGRNLGLAFQLIDDLLGIWGDPAVTGKPARADLAARKKSLPVVAALTSGTPDGGYLASLYHRAEDLGEETLAQAAALVEAAGGRDWAQAEADKHRQRALRALRQAQPDPDAATDLCVLADLITRRDR